MKRLTKRCNGVVTYVGASNKYETGQIPARLIRKASASCWIVWLLMRIRKKRLMR